MNLLSIPVLRQALLKQSLPFFSVKVAPPFGSSSLDKK